MSKIYEIPLPALSVEVCAVRDIDEKTAKECAEDALRWLLYAPEISSDESGHYSLTCLLCQTNGISHSYSQSLVAMQEHLMAQHGFIPDDLARGIRVRCLGDEMLYVWALPSVRAAALQLPHPSYLRAVKYPTIGEDLDVSRDDREVYLSAAVRLGTHVDTISGVLKEDDTRWYPVMVCGRKTPEHFHPYRMVILTQETFPRDEAAKIAWRAHPLFHTQETQDPSL